MRLVNIILAVGAFGSGIIAAWYWYCASQAKFAPPGEIRLLKGEPKPMSQLEVLKWLSEWIFAINQGLGKSSQLNRHAAIWTAISVFLSGAASGLAILASN